MIGATFIEPTGIWPGAFLFFLTAAIAVCVIGEWILGRRWDEAPLPWAALIAASVLGAVVGSKLYMSQHGAWAPALGAGVLPEVHGKNLLGAVAGTLVATWGLRWLLGHRARFEDALGLVLPVAILVGRFGCLFTGCCHGTVTAVPWAMRYGAGSIAARHQIAEGLLAPGAAASLSMHPAPLYEILLVAPLIAGVFWAHRRLRRRGATLLVTVIGYGAIRFGQEFFRYGGPAAGGLKRVQWALLVVLVLAGLALWRRERRPEPEAARPMVPVTPWRLSILSALSVLAGWMVWAWFGPGERFCALLACVPLAWHATEHLAARAAPALSLRWRRLLPVSVTVIAMAAWIPMVRTEKQPSENVHDLRVSFGGDIGQVHYTYTEGCNDDPPTVFTDHAWAIQGTLAYRRNFSDRQFLETGVTAYGGEFGRTQGPSRGVGVAPWYEYYPTPGYIAGAPVTYSVRGAEPYVGYDGYWWSVYGGVHLFGSPELRTGLGVMGAASARLGPRDLAFMDVRFLHELPILTGPTLQWGFGVTMGPVGVMRFGFVGNGSGFYLQPDFRVSLGDGMVLTLTPGYWGAFDDIHRSGGISFSGGLVIPLD
ncbi:MAG: prolipoprotein diacylglyceryl transferase family protein [Pseudomonadota bacterium]